ncbi:glycosyltransferase family 39 protein [Haloarcula halophila]|uniref:glycosyltransferase family 39 protein n=1 Tax=Haloarcula TaxID=2237 RepID=UPI0023E37BB5|nr:glycosyltransferase family 39 protein [Halomicroarcula sp. DFY41]
MELTWASQRIGRIRDWNRQRQLYYGALGAIVLIAVALRFRRLGVASLWIDEAFSSWAAWNFLTGNGFSDPIGPSSPYRRAWLTTSLPIAASFELFGRTEFAARLPSVLYSLGTVGVGYFIAVRYNRLGGLLTAGFLAVDPFFLIWGRVARMYTALGFFFFASIYVILRWYDQEFQFRSPYPFVLVVLVYLGQNAQQAYLALGASTVLFLAMLLAGRLWVLETLSVDAVDSTSKRLAVLIVGGVLVAGLYVVLRGFPGIVTASPPSTWPDRDLMYYWKLFGQAYPVLRYLFVAGAMYLWVQRPDARLLVLAFVVSFVVASVTPRKAPRYVYHLLPLVAIPGLYAIAEVLTVLWRKVTEGDDELGMISQGVVYAVPVVVLLIVASPLAGFAATESVNDSPYHPGVSEWREASAYVTEHADEDDVIVSTRPELSMWYYGETDYFFRQNGLGPVVERDGEYVHPRTGAVYLNDTEDVQVLLEGEQDVWLIAGKKFELNFTDSEARALVQEEFERRGSESWRNIELYYQNGNSTQE